MRTAVATASVPLTTKRTSLRVRIGGQHALGELALAAMRGAEGEAIGGGALHRLDDARMRVTEDQRAPRHAEIEIAVAVFVGGVRALRLRKNTGVPPTLRKARTGLETPAGISASARE